MNIVRAKLIRHSIPDHLGVWPDNVIVESTPLGKIYLIDLDSKERALLHNPKHPEWGSIQLEAVMDVEAFAPLPLCCLELLV